MILPLLGTIAKGAIKGMVSRKRRKKGEGAQVSTSIVKVSKNKGDKKSRSLVKASTPMFGGGKGISETSSSIQSSSIMESLNKIDESIANIRSILISESKFKSKVTADNIKTQNLLLKKTKEKELESKGKNSMVGTGKIISKMGSFLSRFLPFVVATLLGSVVLALYKGLANIIKFFQGIFKALNGFFAALDPYVRPILDFFNLFRKEDTGDLDPKIGETEEEKVNQLEGQVKELDEQADVFVKEFNKQKEELLKATTEYQKGVEVALNKINNDILIAQENTAQENTAQDTEETLQDTEEIANFDTPIDTTNTTEVNPTVSMVNNNINNIIPDKSNQELDVKPTTSLVAKKEEKKSSGNNISADKFFIDGKPPTIAGLRELEESDMNARFKNHKILDYKMNLDAYNQKMYGGTDAIEVNGKTYEPGDSNYGIALELQKATIGKNTEKQWELRQTLIKLEDQAFYETNQTKTNVIFIKDPQVSSSVGGGGGGFILPIGSSKSAIVNSKREEDLKSALYSA